MVEVSLSEARERLCDLIERARKGERIVISDCGVRLVELRPMQPRQQTQRTGGIWKGRVRISEDFDQPLNELEREIYADRV